MHGSAKVTACVLSTVILTVWSPSLLSSTARGSLGQGSTLLGWHHSPPRSQARPMLGETTLLTPFPPTLPLPQAFGLSPTDMGSPPQNGISPVSNSISPAGRDCWGALNELLFPTPCPSQNTAFSMVMPGRWVPACLAPRRMKPNPGTAALREGVFYSIMPSVQSRRVCRCPTSNPGRNSSLLPKSKNEVFKWKVNA
uniref:Uncharacterized protein n=1 Tax=Bubo bubo TaxID=30461 RepID=A0A8C0EKY3_BUBBB